MVALAFASIMLMRHNLESISTNCNHDDKREQALPCLYARVEKISLQAYA